MCGRLCWLGRAKGSDCTTKSVPLTQALRLCVCKCAYPLQTRSPLGAVFSHSTFCNRASVVYQASNSNAITGHVSTIHHSLTAMATSSLVDRILDMHRDSDLVEITRKLQECRVNSICTNPQRHSDGDYELKFNTISEKRDALKVDLPDSHKYHARLKQLVSALPPRLMSREYDEPSNQSGRDLEVVTAMSKSDEHSDVQGTIQGASAQPTEGSAADTCQSPHESADTCDFPSHPGPFSDLCDVEVDIAPGPDRDAKPFCRLHNLWVKEFLDELKSASPQRKIPSSGWASSLRNTRLIPYQQCMPA